MEEGMWEVDSRGIAKAIKQSGKSAPGPDRLPYAAWKHIGVLGQSVLTRLAKKNYGY